VETDAFLVAKARSMKYMMGVARGCWVVSYAWLDACLAAGSWVPEKNFEVKASACSCGPTQLLGICGGAC
jgi:hypothetical protein